MCNSKGLIVQKETNDNESFRKKNNIFQTESPTV